jgi:hypothetical protein
MDETAAMIAEDREAVVAMLRDPATYAPEVARIEEIATRISRDLSGGRPGLQDECRSAPGRRHAPKNTGFAADRETSSQICRCRLSRLPSDRS